MNLQSLTTQVTAQLDKAGLVSADLSKLAGQVPIYYTSVDSKFYFPRADGCYVSVPFYALDDAMRACGIKFPKKDAREFMDMMRSNILKNNSVDSAVRLAGHPAGPVTLKDGRRLLITQGFEMIRPEKGDPSPLLDLLQNFCGGRKEQFLYMFSWLKLFLKDGYRCLEVGVENACLRPSQLLAIIGPPGAGKTLLITLISELVSGTIVNPYPAFSGATNFQGELAESVLLVMDDSADSVRSERRHKLAVRIREFLVVSKRRFEAKNKTSFTAPTFQRLIMVGNEDALHGFPAPQRDFLDKYAILKAYSSEDVLTPRDDDAKEAWIARLRAALPALAYYLIHEFKIPDDMIDSRYGVKAYHDPELLHDLSNAGTEGELLRAIEEAYVTGNAAVPAGKESVIPSPDHPGQWLWTWEGHSREFMVLVSKLPTEQRWNDEFRYRSSAGNLLKSLSDNLPEVVIRGSLVRGLRRWKLCIVCAKRVRKYGYTDDEIENAIVAHATEWRDKSGSGPLIEEEDG